MLLIDKNGAVRRGLLLPPGQSSYVENELAPITFTANPNPEDVVPYWTRIYRPRQFMVTVLVEDSPAALTHAEREICRLADIGGEMLYRGGAGGGT